MCSVLVHIRCDRRCSRSKKVYAVFINNLDHSPKYSVSALERNAFHPGGFAHTSLHAHVVCTGEEYSGLSYAPKNVVDQRHDCYQSSSIQLHANTAMLPFKKLVPNGERVSVHVTQVTCNRVHLVHPPDPCPDPEAYQHASHSACEAPRRMYVCTHVHTYSATRTTQIRGLDPRSGYARLTACHWTLTNPHLTHHTSKQASRRSLSSH
jgi:hypothetical protein